MTPLQRTIHNLAMYGGSVYNEKLNHTYKVTPENLSEVLSIIDELNYKPLLRSFNKLTETVLDGKVPIVELAKMFHVNEKYSFTHCENAIIHDNGICSVNCCVENDSSRYKYYQINLKSIGTIEKRVIDQLNAWGFNTENLDPKDYVEIETLKIK